jgi:hypothetical protein
MTSKRWLILGDALVFLLFATLGSRSHEHRLAPLHILGVAAPFQVGWFVSALATGLYGARAGREGIVKRVLIAWLPAWAIGLAGRHFIFNEDIPVSFDIVALITNAVFLVTWRWLAAKFLIRR